MNRISRARRSAPKTIAFVYAGYKWLEEHADDVERWSEQAMKRSAGKRYATVVTPAAQALNAAAKWARQNRGGSKGGGLRSNRK